MGEKGSTWCVLFLGFLRLCFKERSAMGDSSDLAQWSLQKNLHAADDLGLALGSTIEVLWDVVSEEGEASTSEEKSVWWTGELIGEVTNTEGGVAETDAFGLSSKWRLRYQKY